jgi:hypothetical protein
LVKSSETPLVFLQPRYVPRPSLLSDQNRVRRCSVLVLPDGTVSRASGATHLWISDLAGVSLSGSGARRCRAGHLKRLDTPFSDERWREDTGTVSTEDRSRFSRTLPYHVADAYTPIWQCSSLIDRRRWHRHRVGWTPQLELGVSACALASSVQIISRLQLTGMDGRKG